MADLIFYNGIVHTMNGQTASAAAVSGSLIQAVGPDGEILSLAGPNCRMIDLQGRCLLPGFQDSHCHLLLTGLGYERLNLRGVTSVEELIQAGRDYIRERNIPEGTWVQGEGFDNTLFADPSLPDYQVIEAISDRHPILLERVCGHVGTANRLAMEKIGFDEKTRITGGVIDLDAQGRITGVLREAALDQFKMRIPKPSLEEVKRGITAAAQNANRYGVTSVHTDDLEGADIDTLMQAYHELEEEGQLTVRVWEEVQAARVPVLNRFLERGLRTGDGTDYFRIGNIKLLTDGSLGARTAYMREEYRDDPGNRGVAVYTQDELDEVVMAAHQAGMQIACHAIGDGAAQQCVNALEKAYRSDGADLRNRIVHCQFGDREMFRRMAQNHIAADIQPGFTISDIPYVPSRMGEREKDGYCWKTMLDMGVHLGGGSDCPVESFDPIWGIHCVVNRTDAEGNPAGGWHPDQKMTVEEAVALYTTGGSYLSFEENKKGAIVPGYLADLTVLSADIMSTPPERILDIHVDMTVIGGKAVYERETSED